MDRWSVIRRQAAATLRAFEEARGIPAFTPERGCSGILPDLAEECYGLTVLPDPALPENVRGKLCLHDGTIRVNPRLSPERRVFTIGHDLGHHVLAHPPRHLETSADEIDEEPLVGALSTTDGVYRAYDEHDRWELEANVFAAELLAPIDQIRRQVRDDPAWTVTGLAAYFGISRAALRNQLALALLPGPLEDGEPDGGTAERAEPLPPGIPDPRQDEAVVAETPALVLAGPGAGKTRVLTRRYRHLVDQGVPVRRILALTFANKAADELRDRLAALVPEQAPEIEVSTFHALGLHLLQEYGEHIGLKLPLRILTPVDAFVLLRSRSAELPLGPFEDLHRPSRDLKLLLDAISRAKDELVSPEEFLARARTHQAEIAGHPEPEEEKVRKAWEAERLQAARCVSAGEVYATVQQWYREGGFVDYGDLISETCRLFEIAAVAADIRGRFDHVLVDEFQDTNYASGRFLRALDGGRGIVWAVGDPRQSIYRFRGASPVNLREFARDYPGAQIVPLDQNYRSLEDIVKCGEAIQIPGLTGPDLPLPVPDLNAVRGRSADGAAVEMAVAPTAADERAMIVHRIQDLCRTRSPRQVAVLCRTRTQGRRIADALEAAGVSTNWGGALEDRATFKDLMAVLLLAADDLRGLVRLANLPEYRLSREDLLLLLKAGRERGRSAQAALHCGSKGEIPELSQAGRIQAAALRKLAGRLSRIPTPWRVLSYYLLERAEWPRTLFADPSPEGRRRRTTIGQVATLAREFAARKEVAGGSSPRAFLDYLAASLEAGELTTVGETPQDAPVVNVLTAHRSKGLEWPVVFVPYLAAGQFPSTGYREPLPLPPGVIKGAGPDDEKTEEACLLYVAATRARDLLILSRAERYPKGRTGASPLMTGVVEALQPLGYLRECTVAACRDAAPEVELEEFHPWDPSAPLTYRALDSFKKCPQRFMYESIYGLRGGDNGYPRFHEVVYAVLKWLADAAAAGSVPTQDATLAELERLWKESGPVDHPFEPAYRRNAVKIASNFRDRLQPGSWRQLRHPLALGTESPVLITVDEVEDGSPTILRRHQFRRPAQTHLDDELLVLMEAAYQQQSDAAESVVRVEYPLSGREIDVPITSQRREIWTKKMAERAAQVAAGRFQPQPDRFRCSACPYHFVCPMEGTD